MLIASTYILNKLINTSFKIGLDTELRIRLEDDMCDKCPTDERDNLIEKNNKQIDKKINFIKQNISGRKKYVFMAYFVQAIFLHFSIMTIMKLDFIKITLSFLFVNSIIKIGLSKLLRKYWMKDLFDIFPIMVQM